MSDKHPPTKHTVEFQGDDFGKPFVLGFMADTPETLAARVFEKMCSIWAEREVRAAFNSLMKRSSEGRARRQRLEPFEAWMLGVWDLWSSAPDHSPDSKLEFARFIHERVGGQSVEAVRRQLDRLLEFRRQNPEFMSREIKS